MGEFNIGGIEFRSSKMNAFKQFHIARKLGPVIAKMLPEFEGAGDSIKSLDDIAPRLAPALDALAAMAEEDCNYVLMNALSVVERMQGTVGGNPVWVKVWNERAGRVAFEDIDLAVMLQITVQVVMENLGSFFTVPSSSSREQNGLESSNPTN